MLGRDDHFEEVLANLEKERLLVDRYVYSLPRSLLKPLDVSTLHILPGLYAAPRTITYGRDGI